MRNGHEDWLSRTLNSHTLPNRTFVRILLLKCSVHMQNKCPLFVSIQLYVYICKCGSLKPVMKIPNTPSKRVKSQHQNNPIM